MAEHVKYIEKIRTYLCKNDVRGAFSEEELDLLEAVLGLISYHIFRLSNDYELNDDYRTDVMRVLILLAYKLCYSNLTAELREFIYSFAELIYNWNNNYYKDEAILIICLLLTKLSMTTSIFLELIDASRKLLSKHMDLFMWLPPSIELRKNHLEELLKDNMGE